MSNPYFRFKEFTVYHDRCAMKVGTDGVLLGAWTNVECANTILDVGCGSGLISLMLAQRNQNALVDAIDIDEGAFLQTNINVNNSRFLHQIKCVNNSLQDYELICKHKYDLIVSNPPFFNQSLKSPLSDRTVARHTDSLSADELLLVSSKMLVEGGRLSLIYPIDYKPFFLEQRVLHTTRLTNVYPTPTSPAKRILVELSNIAADDFSENDLVIEKERHIYSDDFVKLVKDFYLNM